jgi:hypothetical protein
MRSSGLICFLTLAAAAPERERRLKSRAGTAKKPLDQARFRVFLRGPRTAHIKTRDAKSATGHLR